MSVGTRIASRATRRGLVRVLGATLWFAAALPVAAAPLMGDTALLEVVGGERVTFPFAGGSMERYLASAYTEKRCYEAFGLTYAPSPAPSVWSKTDPPTASPPPPPRPPPRR
jgi:hypothetical protein